MPLGKRTGRIVSEQRLGTDDGCLLVARVMEASNNPGAETAAAHRWNHHIEVQRCELLTEGRVSRNHERIVVGTCN